MSNVCTHCCTRVEDVSVAFPSGLALDKVNLHLNCREVVAIIGPNGAGKTTLLKAMLGEVGYSGRIHYLVKGEPGRRPIIGYVPQRLQCDADSPISVFDFVAATMRSWPVCFGVTKAQRSKVSAILDRVDVGHVLKRRVGGLSGGELQRVLLALAIHPMPDLLLMDEPIAAVDVQGMQLFYQLINDIKKEHDVSIVMVTHDLAGVAAHVDTMILLNRSVVTEGSPHEVLHSRHMQEVFGPNYWYLAK